MEKRIAVRPFVKTSGSLSCVEKNLNNNIIVHHIFTNTVKVKLDMFSMSMINRIRCVSKNAYIVTPQRRRSL
jgi:hypothetical protein